MDPLFEELPEDLSGLSDEDLDKLEADHRDIANRIVAEDAELLEGMAATDVLAQFKVGVEQVERIVAERGSRAEAAENYEKEKAELQARLTVEETEEEGAPEEKAEEIVAETDTEGDDDGDEGNGDGEPEPEGEEAKERELVTAAVTESTKGDETAPPPKLRRPPAPSAARVVQEEAPTGTALVAAGEMGLQFRDPLTPDTLAQVVLKAAQHHGPHPKVDPVGKYRFGGPEHKIARADFQFPDDRTLDGDDQANLEKIEAVVVNDVPGGVGKYSLTASGGICAPATPFYTMPNFATDDEPVWDSLPKFAARRGAVNIPTPTTIADITTAISTISEANDALGGTFATKSCQDLTCPAYTETAVSIFAHCREYGNLNARTWPEKIAHENALTMAALARTGEGFILDRIKALSVNVTNGATTLSSMVYLVEAIVRSAFGIRGRLRMPAGSRFRAILPSWVPDVLVLDTISTPFDRFRSRESLVDYLRSVGIDPVFYLDTPSTGTTQLPDASQTAAAIDATPVNIQWAIHPQSAFLGIDAGSLELGIVRDSTLNSTNDFQVFGERFRNVALLAPAQAAYWVTTTYCAGGQLPPAGTARTCP